MAVENIVNFSQLAIYLMAEFQTKQGEPAISKLKLQSGNTGDFLVKAPLKT